MHDRDIWPSRAGEARFGAVTLTDAPEAFARVRVTLQLRDWESRREMAA